MLAPFAGNPEFVAKFAIFGMNRRLFSVNYWNLSTAIKIFGPHKPRKISAQTNGLVLPTRVKLVMLQNFETNLVI